MRQAFMGLVLVALAAASVPAQTDTTATAQTTPPAVAPAAGAVPRAVICSGVAEREPIDALITVPGSTEKVFCFTEIIGMEGKTITHRWVREGATVAEVPIAVGAARWRCYSTKTIAGMTGAWSVQVIDDAGTTIGEASFTVSAP
jgi:hypothetical protein